LLMVGPPVLIAGAGAVMGNGGVQGGGWVLADADGCLPVVATVLVVSLRQLDGSAKQSFEEGRSQAGAWERGKKGEDDSPRPSLGLWDVPPGVGRFGRASG
jgi:hypothetical protein